MLIAILVTLLMIVFLFLGIRRNKNTLYLVLMLSALGSMLFILLLYLGKLSYCRSEFQIENMVFLYLYRIKCSLSMLKTMLNMSICLFYVMLLEVATAGYIRPTVAKAKILWIYTISFICIAYFLFANTPGSLENLYLMRNADEITEARGTIVSDIIIKCNYGVMLWFFILPIVMKINYYRNTRIMFKKIEICVILFCMLFIESLFIILVIVSPLKFFAFDTRYYYDFVDIKIAYDEFLYVWLPVIFTIVFIVIIHLLIKYRIVDFITILKQRFVVRKTRVPVAELGYIFHSCKNEMLSIMALERKAEDNYGTDEGLKCLEKIKQRAMNFSNHAERFMKAYSKIHISYEIINISEVISEAVSSILQVYSVRINQNYTQTAYVYGDREQLREMICNILQNSVEAIELSQKNDGLVMVDIMTEDGMVCISIYDNGVGIDRKTKRNMYKISYSEKRSNKNWGIGLSHVYNIVKAHKGFINVQSEIGRYTEFQIVLPERKKISE